MFKLVFMALKGFLSAVGSVIIGIILLSLFAPVLTDIIVTFALGILVTVLLFSGMLLDYNLRKKFNLSHKQMFSPLWTTLSIVELSLFAVFVIVIILGLVPISVLIYNLLIYIVLSVLILTHKIKKVANA